MQGQGQQNNILPAHIRAALVANPSSPSAANYFVTLADLSGSFNGIYSGNGSIPVGGSVATIPAGQKLHFAVTGSTGRFVVAPAAYAGTGAIVFNAPDAGGVTIEGFNGSENNRAMIWYNGGRTINIANFDNNGDIDLCPETGVTSRSRLAIGGNGAHISDAKVTIQGANNSVGNVALYVSGSTTANGFQVQNDNRVGVGAVGSTSTKFNVRGIGATSATITARFANSAGSQRFLIADNGQVSFGVGQAAANPTTSFGERHDITGFTYGASFTGNNCTTAVMLVQTAGNTDWGIYSVIQASTFTGDSIAIHGNNLNTNNPSSATGVRGSGRNGSSVSVGVDGLIPGGASFASASYVAAVRGQATPNVNNGINYGGYFRSAMNNATLAYTGDFIGVYGLGVGTSGAAGSTSHIIGGKFLTQGTVGTGKRMALLVPATSNNGTVVFGADTPSALASMLEVKGDIQIIANGANDGLVLTDRTLGGQKRFYLDNGNLQDEAA